MIQQLVIRNFKTIKDLELPCKRYNLFIGDTNTGKTNIIEALTLLAQNNMRSPYSGGAGSEFDRRTIRYGQLNDLFPGRDITEKLIVETESMWATLTFDQQYFHLHVKDPDGRDGTYDFQSAGNMVGQLKGAITTTSVRRYQYDPNVVMGPHRTPHLSPPDGANLAALLISNAQLTEELEAILSAKDLAFEINPDTYVISLRHERAKHIVVQLPFASLSETIKRYIFLFAALRTNQNAVLLLDEPEQNTFPFYTKHIAELMAREPSNQYFVTTHNQYLLQSIIEKAPEGEVQVIATFRKDGFTRTRIVPLPEVMELMEYDLFLNLDRLVEA